MYPYLRNRNVAVVGVLEALVVFTSQLRPAAQGARNWDETFRAIPDAKNISEYARRMSARPHHLGSPYDKDNAEWILAKFKEFGWDARIETYSVLFPTPRERSVELVAPTSFKATLREPAVARSW